MSHFDRSLEDVRTAYQRCDQERQANAEAAAAKERELRQLRAENRRLQARVDVLEQDVARLTGEIAKAGGEERQVEVAGGVKVVVLEGSG